MDFFLKFSDQEPGPLEPLPKDPKLILGISRAMHGPKNLIL